MANIAITNLESNDAESLLISLETGDSALVKSAVKRALDARQITGGMVPPRINLPDYDPSVDCCPIDYVKPPKLIVGKIARPLEVF